MLVEPDRLIIGPAPPSNKMAQGENKKTAKFINTSNFVQKTKVKLFFPSRIFYC